MRWGMNLFSLSKKGVYRRGKIDIGKCDVGLRNKTIGAHVPENGSMGHRKRRSKLVICIESEFLLYCR
jgi:hypothetical protein